MSVPRTARAVIASMIAALLLLPAPTAAQLPEPGDLPIPDAGAVGELLDPIGELIDDLLGTIDEDLRDLPMDNAIRLLGQDAVAAAIALSQATFDRSTTAFLARDDVFADTLSSVSAQGIAGAPLLLTPTGEIDQRVQAELDRLGVTDIIILGNESAIADEVEAQLASAGYTVDRAGGPTRIETAVEIAELIAPDADTAIILRAYPGEGAPQSQAYVDALAAGPFGSLNRYPVLLTTSEDLHPATREYLEAASIRNVVIIGGEAAVSPSVATVLQEVTDSVTRIAGATRFETAIAIANAMGYQTAADPARIILTEAGDSALPLWAAGYAAAAHAAVFDAPVLLADGALLPNETIVFLAEGLLQNALRLTNEPLICNSFVNIIACETAALLMVGLLEEVDALLGGTLGDILGPVLDQLLDALPLTLPGADGLSPALVTELLALLGLPTDGGTAAFASQPAVVQDALVTLLGTDDDRPSTSRQAIQIALLRELATLLEGVEIDTSDPAQAAAAAEVLSGIGTLLGHDGGDLPLVELEELLAGIAHLAEPLIGAVDLVGLGELVDDLGVDGQQPVTEVLDTVGSLLSAGGDSTVLTGRYGSEAAGLAGQVDQLQRRWGQ